MTDLEFQLAESVFPELNEVNGAIGVTYSAPGAAAVPVSTVPGPERSVLEESPDGLVRRQKRTFNFLKSECQPVEQGIVYFGGWSWMVDVILFDNGAICGVDTRRGIAASRTAEGMFRK